MIIGSSDIHFGDSWRTVSIGVKCSVDVGHPLVNAARLYREIADALDGGEKITVWTRYTTPFDYSIFRVDPGTIPTKRRWKRLGFRNQCVYQFDGVAHAKLKNPPLADVSNFLAFSNCRKVKLGKHLSVDDCISACLESDFFIGCDSGMAQLAYSVGIPVYLVAYEQKPIHMKIWHNNKPKAVFKDMQEFLPNLESCFLGLDRKNI